jgi:hypothetical protein
MTLLYCLGVPFYQISNLIGGSLSLPSGMLYDPLPGVFVDIRFGGIAAPFRHTLHCHHQVQIAIK